MRIIKGLFSLIASCVVLVLTLGTIQSLSSVLKESGYFINGQSRYFTLGFLLYFPLHIIFRRFIIIHIFGHELTHAIWAALFGGKVQEIYASQSNGGFTVYTKENFLVLLAPYFFPLYALVFLFLFHVSKSPYDNFFLMFTGVSISFHIVLTLWSIRLGQSDIKRVGVIFSLCFILMMNVLIIGMIICSVQPGCNPLDFVEQSLDSLPRNIKTLKCLVTAGCP